MRDPLISLLGEDSGAPGWLEPWLLGPLGLQEKVHKWRNTDLTPDFLKRNQGTWEDQHPVWEGKRKPWFWSPHLSSLGSHHSGWTLTNFNQNSQLSLILQIRTLGFPMNSDPPKATGGRTFFYNIFSIFRKWCLFLCTYITAVRLSECHLSCFPLSHLFSVSTVSLCVTSLCSSHSLCFSIVLILSLFQSLLPPSLSYPILSLTLYPQFWLDKWLGDAASLCPVAKLIDGCCRIA